MITDVTGTPLTPGNLGKDCAGNGQSTSIECCCDECDYGLCCQPDHKSTDCLHCTDTNCPRKQPDPILNPAK